MLVTSQTKSSCEISSAAVVLAESSKLVSLGVKFHRLCALCFGQHCDYVHELLPTGENSLIMIQLPLQKEDVYNVDQSFH